MREDRIRLATTRRRAGVWPLLLAWVCACAASPPSADCALDGGLRADSTEQPIAATRLAELSVMIAQYPPRVRCSGVWVGPRWVLTAAHCAADSLFVGIGTDAEHAQWWRVVRSEPHPKLDVMLIETQPVGIEHARSAYTAVELASVGTRVVIAGFGRQSQGGSGRLKSMPAVVARSGDRYAISTAGPEKPCSGDSGAAVFAVLGGGDELWLLGILKGGSILCDGSDVAERLAACADWLMAQLEPSGCEQ